MELFFAYIRVFVFLGCVLVGIQVPAFVDQYGKNLESRLLESRIALSEFQAGADKYFAGSVEELIAHYKRDDDQVFIEGGRSIQSIYARNLMLARSFAQFEGSSWSAYTQALISPVPDVRKEVWKNYSYAIQLNPSAVAFGLVTGLIFTLGFELLLRLLCNAPKLLNKRFQTTP
ncbi:MAG: DUF2937 family protein [Desulfuromonadaceae bacterium]|nr:DUF2937 family protein [Desulfuromonadaceae bacterium]